MTPEDRYDIIHLIHKGRAGGVYRAEDTLLHREVAMRRLYSETGSTDISFYKDDFITISQQIAALEHPGITKVLDAGIDSDGAYIISEINEGHSLLEMLKARHPFRETEGLEIIAQILEALDYAHQHQFYHGSINLTSISLEQRARGGYRSTITDLGLSHLASFIHGVDCPSSYLADPTMIAPEIHQGSPPSALTDLYSCGHLCYTILIGTHPFINLPREEVYQKNQRDLIPKLTDISEISPATSQWVHQLIQAKKSNRTPSIKEAIATIPITTTPKHYVRQANKPFLFPNVSQNSQSVTQHYPSNSSNFLTQTNTLNKRTVSPTHTLPLYITICLFIACVSIGWIITQPQSVFSKEVQTLHPPSSDLTLETTLESPKETTHSLLNENTKKGRRLAQDERFSSFSKALSIYAHWYFTPDYFNGLRYDYYYAKQSKLHQPPTFKDELLVFHQQQVVHATRELANSMPRDQFTLEAFVHIDEVCANGGIISCSEDSETYSRGFYLGYNETGAATFKVSSSKKTTLLQSHTTPFPSHQWVHLVGVFQQNSLHLFINGKETARAPHGHKMTMARDLPKFLLGGYQDKDTSSAMTGAIRAAAIYRSALTTNEVKELYLFRSTREKADKEILRNIKEHQKIRHPEEEAGP